MKERNSLAQVTSQSIDVPVMSSREIARLTDKQHQHVKRDIEKMLLALKIDASKFGHIYYDSQNRGQFEYLLNRDHTYCLLIGYSVILRMKVIKRWEELERSNSLQAPTTMIEALELALAQSKQLEVQQTYINSTKDDVEFSAIVNSSKAGINIGTYAKSVGLGQNTLFRWLRDNKILMKDLHIPLKRSHNLPLQKFLSQGYFVVKEQIIHTAHGPQRTATTLITGKGEQWLTKKLIESKMISSPALTY